MVREKSVLEFLVSVEIISALTYFYWGTLVLSFEAHGHTIACEGGRDSVTL